MSYTITATAGSENIVNRTNTFIASSLAFGCHVGCHRRIFVVGLLFLSTTVLVLLDFNMMEQYQSHTRKTLACMEEYLDPFHRMKDIFLKFQVSKRTRAKVHKQRNELQQERAQSNMRVAQSKRRRPLEQGRDEENDLHLDMFHLESHFNFLKMHLLSHFSDHVRQFGNIPMYSTEIVELAHKKHIKDGWGCSNKHDVEQQILHSNGRQHAI